MSFGCACRLCKHVHKAGTKPAARATRSGAYQSRPLLASRHAHKCGQPVRGVHFFKGVRACRETQHEPREGVIQSHTRPRRTHPPERFPGLGRAGRRAGYALSNTASPLHRRHWATINSLGGSNASPLKAIPGPAIVPTTRVPGRRRKRECAPASPQQVHRGAEYENPR